ncbi:glycosyltransferase [Moraxella sp. RCAD0137]|uniref:glycosyltransferase n=1 Tax=Moraxella sp. RCAD0137 TaxID=1775913 RepID=UPI000C9FA09C|nr:glycosyltransferase [Moraxella sp. RCAD0137]PNP98971.1 hypothetical protein AZ602_00740 [Moraxella sp. RCAD0137]
MKDKVLVFFPRSVNINAGGPAGFLAHNLADKPKDDFVLSSDFLQPMSFIKKTPYRIKRFFNKLQNGNQVDHKAYFQAREHFFHVKANTYKYIYFHEDVDYFRVKDLISDNQCVIFQPHCPQKHSEEYKEYSPNDVTMHHYIQQAEKAVFERADIVVLPNADCLPIYQDLYTSRNKFYFILSGAKSSYNNQSQTKFDLPQNQINLMYIGRRNHVKGFDIVINSFRRARHHRKDIHLYVIGHGDLINEDGITDIGFSNNPIAWYNSVDYLINANRQSYFDLSIIEAISTGVPIIMSENLGHKYYKNTSALIKMFEIENSDALVNILIHDLKKRDFQDLSNINLYQNYLTDTHYYHRFIDFIKYLHENSINQ